ncbi:MAG: sensor histidine kinase [Ferruginibacter sp.]|nr:sensor histidine kinase [Ferruginibacter sp.]
MNFTSNFMRYLNKVCCALIFLFFQQMARAQPRVNVDSVKTDSINKILKKETKNIGTFRTYLQKLDTLSNDEFIVKEAIANWLISNSDTREYAGIKIEAQQLLGRAYYHTGNYVLAHDYLNKVLATSKEDDYFETKSKALEAQAQVFYQTEQPEKQKEYILKNLAYSKKNNYKQGIAVANENYTSILQDNDYQTGKDTFNMILNAENESIKIWKELKDTGKIIHVIISKGQAYADYHFFDTGINIVLSAKEYFTNRNKESSVYYNFILGKIYFNKAKTNNNNATDYKNAIKYFEICIPLAQQFKNKKQEAWCYDWLSASYKFLGNYQQAYKYLEKYSYLNDGMVNEENFKKITSVEHKYETEKKDKEIVTLESKTKQKATLNKILIGAAAALVFIGFLGYRNFRSKQQIQQQIITELEKEKQLHAVDAMLKGQEEERGRLAKDLHDGLGGMLSGVKMSFSNMKENMIMDASNTDAFEKSITQLDNTITELRKVAHNLMPEALVKFGLKNAVEDFCRSMELSSKTKIICEQLGSDRDLGNSANVNVYRIVQELVNNAIKHAQASQILVQLTKSSDKVLLTVEDDGKGFDINTLENATGIGYINLKQRVAYLNGKMDIETKPSQGTAVNIELTA